ncbi:hypothetical protein Thal_0480 [Thermocrinis albus DSM 14484]|uniref:Uncharacterized protein n=1 Tax=Thermocrinis albus (strain DSM 14484 / JCM 11386 / HI 11/12) TaxID=638303 RepID=D3SPM7_THEAH|nr:hypothetical protein [Thermocrinis albus]ADC89114.1 hypothetical protein Thal_0480 [Thermocrinis albus DSM 14484]
METLWKLLEPLMTEPLFQFFLYMALLQILVQVFLERRYAFWVSSVITTYFWTQHRDLITAVKGWGVILAIVAVYLLMRRYVESEPFLYLRGVKRCPVCCSVVSKRARVCPFCRTQLFQEEKDGTEG